MKKDLPKFVSVKNLIRLFPRDSLLKKMCAIPKNMGQRKEIPQSEEIKREAVRFPFFITQSSEMTALKGIGVLFVFPYFVPKYPTRTRPLMRPC
ncbi:MAG: hypothetical protein IKT59_04795 [Bacteroidales bacterium]|nr:hypothetical protein [Bacteroidales bacterium]